MKEGSSVERRDIESKLLSLPEAAKMTGTSVAFWRKRVLFEDIETVRVGRLVKLSREAIMAYLAARTRPARTAAK